MSASPDTLETVPSGAGAPKTWPPTEALPKRNISEAMWRGAIGKCPNCGKGHMFRAFLKVTDTCTVCGEELHHHRADDMPPYITIVIVGHIIVTAVLAVESAMPLPVWLQLTLWLPATLILTLALLQPVKGGIVGLQWALRMHGFHAKGDPDDVTATHWREGDIRGG